MTNIDLRVEYERLVMALAAAVGAMRACGLDAEAIARDVHAKRRSLARRFKDETPEPLRTEIIRRTVERYGDPMGPTIDSLRSAGKSWTAIADSATRPGHFPLPLAPAQHPKE